MLIESKNKNNIRPLEILQQLIFFTNSTKKTMYVASLKFNKMYGILDFGWRHISGWSNEDVWLDMKHWWAALSLRKKNILIIEQPSPFCYKEKSCTLLHFSYLFCVLLQIKTDMFLFLILSMKFHITIKFKPKFQECTWVLMPFWYCRQNILFSWNWGWPNK